MRLRIGGACLRRPRAGSVLGVVGVALVEDLHQSEVDHLLLNALAVDDLRTRVVIIRALDKRHPEWPVDVVVERLRSASGAAALEESLSAEEVLQLGLEGWRRLPLVRIFGEALNSEDRELRLVAVRILGNSGDRHAVEYLEPARQDTDEEVRTEASLAIRRLKRTTSD